MDTTNKGQIIPTEEAQTGAGPVTMVTGSDRMPDFQLLTHRVRLLERNVRDNIRSSSQSESALQTRIRELEESEKCLKQKVDELTTSKVLHCPSMQQRQRLDERLHTLREEVRSVSQEKERGEHVWRERLQRCHSQLRAKEEEMGRQSQYFEHFKSQLQQKLGQARDREQVLQTRVHQLERQMLEMTVSAATKAACLSPGTAATGPTLVQRRTETDSERFPHTREEGEGEEEDMEVTARWRRQPQLKQGTDDREIEGGGKAEGPGAEARLTGVILGLQEDLRVLLEREEEWLAERRRLMEQLQEAQENGHFLSCKVEEMRTLVHRLKLTESSLTEEVEELQEENRRLCQRLSYTLREVSHKPGSTHLSPRPAFANSPSSSSADPRPSLATPLPNGVALHQANPCAMDNNAVNLTPGQSSLSAHQHGPAEMSQVDFTSSLPHPDLLNLSGHCSENNSLLALGTKSSEPGQMGLGDWCAGSGRFPSLNLDKGTSEETEALREAYMSLGGDMDSLWDPRDALEVTVQHTQDQMHRVTEESDQMTNNLREQGDVEAYEMERGSSLKGSSATNVQENRVPSQSPILHSGSTELGIIPTQDQTVLAFTQEDPSLQAPAQDELVLALNLENRALGRRIEELLAHIQSQEEDSERELGQLRLQVSLMERESSSLEQDNQEMGGLITELTRKTEDDLNTIMELQQRLAESSQPALKQADHGSTIQSECGQQADHGSTIQSECGQQADRGSTIQSECGQQADHGSTIQSECGQQADRGSTIQSECGQQADHGSTIQSECGQQAEHSSTIQSECGQQADHGSTIQSECGQQADRGSTIQSECGQQADLGSTIQSGCGQQGEHNVVSISAKQVQHIVGLEKPVNRAVLQVNHMVRSVGCQQEDHLTAESVGGLRKEKDELIGSLRDLRAEREQVTLSVNSQTEEKHRLTRSLWLLKEERDQISQSLCRLKEEKEQLARSVCALKNEGDKLTRSLCASTEQRDQLVQSVCVLREERDELSQSLSSQKDEREQLNKSLPDLEEERRQLMKSVCRLKEERDQLAQTVRSLQQDRAQLSSPCHQTEEREQLDLLVCFLKEEKDQLVQSVEGLRENRKQLTEERDQLQMDVAALRNKSLSQGWSHDRQPIENHVGMPTHVKGVATERGVPVPYVDGDVVTQGGLAMVYSYKTDSPGQSAQDRLGGTPVEQVNLVTEIQSLGVELKRTTEEMEKTKSESQRWYRELSESEMRHEEAEKKVLQAANELKMQREETVEVQEMNDTLRAKVAEMRSHLAGLEREKTDALSLRTKVEEQLSLLQAELEAKSVALTELSSEYTSLKRQQGNKGNREDWITTVTSLRAHYDDIRAKYNVLLRQKSQTDLDIAPLKAKLSLLVLKCQQRNSVLLKMMRALRRYGSLDYNLTQEAEDLLSDTALQDYTCTFTLASTVAGQENTLPVQPPVSELLEHTMTSPGASTAQLSLSTDESVQVTGVPDRCGVYHAKVKGEFGLIPCSFLVDSGRPFLMTSPLPVRSASPSRKLTTPEKIINLHQQLQNTLSNNYQKDWKSTPCQIPTPVYTTTSPSFFHSPQLLPSKSRPQVYYSPSLGLESYPGYQNPNLAAHIQPQHTPITTTPTTSNTALSSTTATTTQPCGPDPCTRNCAAQINLTTADLSRPGQSLCDASATSKTTSPVRTPSTAMAWTVKEPTSIASWNSTKPTPKTAVTTNTTVATKMAATQSSVSSSLVPVEVQCVKKPFLSCQPEQANPTNLTNPRDKSGHPAEVSSVEVIRMVGKSSLMIGWERPPLDELGCSNGTFVFGYRIYVDGEFHKSVMSSACTKCVLENLDLSGQVHISVQTLGSNGLYAEKVHLIYKGTQDSFMEGHNHFITDHPRSNTAAAASSPDSRTPPTHPHTDFTQPFVAIYSYIPLRDSPNLHPSRELALTEGDTVMLLGNPRSDGFCEAEVNGTQGLAPRAFLEKLPVPDRHVSIANPQSSSSRGPDDRPL